MTSDCEEGNPETRRQMYNAVIIRQSRPFRRVDGTWVQFEDNACVITNDRGEVQGSDIKGPVSRKPERWPRTLLRKADRIGVRR